MSLAWGSLVVLLLLLPGVWFFVGLHIPEKFTRQTAEQSPLGQLGAVLLVSFLVQSGMFLALRPICQRLEWIPCVDLRAVLSLLVLDKPSLELSGMLGAHAAWIVLYVVASVALGMLAGYGIGRGVVSGKLSRLTQHPWIHDLSVGDNFTVAYVMTHIRQNERILLYHGFLKQFGLQRDGRFSYLVLTGAHRGYMKLDEDAPRTTSAEHWARIGDAPESISRALAAANKASRGQSVFVIEGEDIANVVFDRIEYSYGGTEKDFGVFLSELNADIIARALHDAASFQPAVLNDLMHDEEGEQPPTD